MNITRRCFMAAIAAVVSVLDFLEPSSPAPMTPAPPPRRDPIKGGDLLWGTFGKDGRQPLRYVRLIDCTSDHLRAILRTQPHITQQYRDAIDRILKYRGAR